MRSAPLRRAAWLGVAALTLLAPRAASAFCGFYVASADAPLTNEATQVVLMREGTRTVLSMQNSYKGPPEGFAMVVPVPVVLQKENVKTLPREVFERIDKLGAPRLVEYWELDPCAGIGLGMIGTLGGGGGMGAGFGSGRGRLGGDDGVTVEAKFEVGEYDIVILGAKDAAGLETWLHDEKYAIPAGAEPLLRPYVAAGSKFFVAKVDPKKVAFKDGRAALSPLRFHYDASTFSLPVRLGLINSGGTQDLVINILARGKRYEAANYPNVTIPTNLDVSEGAKTKFGEFYAALFDRTLERTPKAIVTEYAWDAGSCDPCPTPILEASELTTLGADVLVPLPDGGVATRLVGQVRQTDVSVGEGLSRDVVERIVRRRFNLLKGCYEGSAGQSPQMQSLDTTIKMKIDAHGAVNPSIWTGHADLDSCLSNAITTMSFPSPTTASVDVSFGLAFRMVVVARAVSPNEMVLTRLHARYDKSSLGEDIVFKDVAPIAGGREHMQSVDAGIERGSTPSGANNFQARYVIRHPWTGAIACAEPTRGMWGGPPKDAGASAPSPQAATGLAFVPRGKTALASFVKEVPEIGFDAAKLPPPPPDPPDAPAAKKSCAGCAAAPKGSAWGGLGAGLLGGAILAMRRARRRRALARPRSAV